MAVASLRFGEFLMKSRGLRSVWRLYRGTQHVIPQLHDRSIDANTAAELSCIMKAMNIFCLP